MSFGVIMMVHGDLARVAEVARHWSAQGSPVVIHIDKKTPELQQRVLRTALADLGNLRFSPQFACAWGTWSLVAATKAAAEVMLAEFPDIGHVVLTSGSCLPVRPAAELRRFLAAQPGTDFIESVAVTEVPWAIGGLDAERFAYDFPFSWKTQRRLFDLSVKLQRLIGRQRDIPDGISPHLGSQWWCLTRATLQAILTDADQTEIDGYFRRVWIPDESYFQTMARKHSRSIESRSLTLSRFDAQGRPFMFYDDHADLLRQSGRFIARKIWPGAVKLYTDFLDPALRPPRYTSTGRIERVFSSAIQRRSHGRPGLFNQGRFPDPDKVRIASAGKYTVLEGLGFLVPGLDAWLRDSFGIRAHGHLFAQDGAEFAEAAPFISGNLTNSPGLRDYDVRSFMRNLIWNTRGREQCFRLGPADNLEVTNFLAQDENAQVVIVTGAWAVDLYQRKLPKSVFRQIAARYQVIESDHLRALRQPRARCRLLVRSLAEFLENQGEVTQAIATDFGARQSQSLLQLPKLAIAPGFGSYMQELKNAGLFISLLGDYQTIVEYEEVSMVRDNRIVDVAK